MNKNKLRAICQKLAKELDLSFNSVQTHYFLESILEKIAKSDESKNFIFKGGFLLANVIGISQRNTVDIDFLIRNFTINEETIRERFEKILAPREDDVIFYEIQKVEGIRNDDAYGGFRVTILCKLENIRQVIPLDIATGDPVTPTFIQYRYKSAFQGNSINIHAYNLETMLAEKIQTVYQRGMFNSRSKDFYDIYILYHLKRNEINFDVLKTACINTFEYRNTEFDVDSIIVVLESIKSDQDFYYQWKNYQKRFKYADNINFDTIIDTAVRLVNKIRWRIL